MYGFCDNLILYLSMKNLEVLEFQCRIFSTLYNPNIWIHSQPFADFLHDFIFHFPQNHSIGDPTHSLHPQTDDLKNVLGHPLASKFTCVWKHIYGSLYLKREMESIVSHDHILVIGGGPNGLFTGIALLTYGFANVTIQEKRTMYTRHDSWLDLSGDRMQR